MADTNETVRSLVEAVGELAAALTGAVDDEAVRVHSRLHNSVIRPLRQAMASAPAEPSPSAPAGSEPSHKPVTAAAQAIHPHAALSEALWSLARAATELRVALPDRPDLHEATAALQDLAIGLADESSGLARLAELEALHAELGQQIEVAGNGPYLVANARRLDDWLGRPLPTRPQLALCRCGGSSIKPLCDGTHASIGFTGAKDPKRIADRRDIYVGQQVTVLDNRATCQHSGYCTERLATVFHLGEEPFVTPSGGRMDEIIRAVRDCPSGALSYAIDGVEATSDVDFHATRQPTIEVSKDGPYRITGGIPLVGHDGEAVPRNDGASSEHFALCRCGSSQNKPFCNGMHWRVEFRDPQPDADHEPSIFEWAGGLPALTRMTRLFYERHVPQDPLLAPLFSEMSRDHPERVAKWLGEVFCGPKCYSAEYGGYTHMISEHIGRCLTEEQRARWVELLLQSAREAGLPNDAEFRAAFGAYIEWGSRLAVENSQTDSRPPANMPMPHWDWHTAAGPPASRVSALAAPAPEDEAAAVLPAIDEPVRFDDHIKALFRSRDRQSMTFAFDLWSYEHVSQHADAILQRLRAGTMPCDGAWPDLKIDVFQRWMDAGKPR